MADSILLSVDDLKKFLTGDFLDDLADKLAEKEQSRKRAMSLRPLSDREAARRLNVSVSTLRRLKKSDRIGSVETPQGRKVREADIEEYFS